MHVRTREKMTPARHIIKRMALLENRKAIVRKRHALLEARAIAALDRDIAQCETMLRALEGGDPT